MFCHGADRTIMNGWQIVKRLRMNWRVGSSRGGVNREATWVSVSVRIGLGFMLCLDNFSPTLGNPYLHNFLCPTIFCGSL